MKVSDFDIIEKYREEYDSYAEEFKTTTFDSFIKFIINEKKIYDADVTLFYAVFCGDTALVKTAIELGANPGITDVEIKERYLKEYEDFLQIKLK